MKILYHHRTQAKGVEGVHINGVVQGLRACGHKVRMVALSNGTGPEEGGGQGRGKRKTSPIWSGISRFLPEYLFNILEILYNGYAWVRIGKALRAGQIDLIYERYALFSIAGVLQARRYGIPLILEVNDGARLERVRPLKSKKLASWFEQKIFLAADGIITISGPFKRYIVECGVDEKKVRVLPNAVDPEQFCPGKRSLQEDDHDVRKEGVVIGFIGSFAPWHGLDLLVRAFSELAGRYPEIRLLLIGKGKMLNAVRQMVREKGLDERVTITGSVPHEEIRQFIEQMDIAVMPDSNTYGSPMKIFEYMAMEKAVVAPSYEPIREVLEDRRSGFLFPPRDLQALTEALSQLIEDGRLRKQIGIAARRATQERFNWNRYARSILQLHETELESRTVPVSQAGHQ